MAEPVGTEETPPLLRTLIEAVAAQLGMGRGHWRGEFIFENGRLRECYRHERIAASALSELETEPTGV